MESSEAAYRLRQSRLNPYYTGCTSGGDDPDPDPDGDGGLNPYYTGCTSGGLFKYPDITANQVSILIILDVPPVELNQKFWKIDLDQVSILIILDVPPVVPVIRTHTLSPFGLNPYYTGCTSGGL